jgi:hypothetical protein
MIKIDDLIRVSRVALVEHAPELSAVFEAVARRTVANNQLTSSLSHDVSLMHLDDRGVRRLVSRLSDTLDNLVLPIEGPFRLALSAPKAGRPSTHNPRHVFDIIANKNKQFYKRKFYWPLFQPAALPLALTTAIVLDRSGHQMIRYGDHSMLMHISRAVWEIYPAQQIEELTQAGWEFGKHVIFVGAPKEPEAMQFTSHAPKRQTIPRASVAFVHLNWALERDRLNVAFTSPDTTAMERVSQFLSEPSGYQQLLDSLGDMELQTSMGATLAVHFPSLLTRIESVTHQSLPIELGNSQHHRRHSWMAR